MGFKSLNQSIKYFKYNECNPEDVLVQEGVYLETFEGKFGHQHKFREKESGQLVVLNSAGHLNYQVNQLKTGQVVRVIYKGTTVLEKGAMSGKEAHQFDVQVDEDSIVTEKVLNVQETTPAASLDDLA